MGWVDGLNIALIVSLIANVILGFLHSKHRSLIIKLTTKIAYLAKLLNDLEQALQDNKITNEEAVKLIQDAKKLIEDP